MKVAVTIWEGRISPVFDACREVRVLSVEARKITSETLEVFDGNAPEDRIERLNRLGVEVLVCGAISEPLQAMLLERGIDVIGFVAGDADEVVKAFLSRTLPNHSMAMPGCFAKRKRHRRRRHRRGGFGSPCLN